MDERLDLYAGVHKGLRSCMQAALLRLGQADPADPEDVRAALDGLREALTWNGEHLEIEERFVHDAIERRDPGHRVALRDEHEDHRRTMAVLRADADALERSVGEPVASAGARLRQLYLAFSRHVAENLAHMAYEETEMNARLWSLFSEPELLEIFAAIVASETPEQLGRSVRFILPALTPADRAALLGGARPNMPVEVFDGLLATIRGLVSPRDWAKLEEALGLDRAA